jgi:TPR repeat protein
VPAAQGTEPTPAEPKQEQKQEPAQEQKQEPAQEQKPAPAPPPDHDNKAANIPATSSRSVPVIDVDLIEQAKAGDAKAQYILGYDYYLGQGIAQDYVQAGVWWKKSADQGRPDAQNNLGVLYNSGKGVPQSFSEAYFWQNLAAARANGDLQVQFAKNRDESASRLSLFERLRVQKRASKWASDHPVPPRSHEPSPDHQ